jgi:hypothetical protein
MIKHTIKIIKIDKKRCRTKCMIFGTYYDLPSGLVKKLISKELFILENDNNDYEKN